MNSRKLCYRLLEARFQVSIVLVCAIFTHFLTSCKLREDSTEALLHSANEQSEVLDLNIFLGSHFVEGIRSPFRLKGFHTSSISGTAYRTYEIDTSTGVAPSIDPTIIAFKDFVDKECEVGVSFDEDSGKLNLSIDVSLGLPWRRITYPTCTAKIEVGEKRLVFRTGTKRDALMRGVGAKMQFDGDRIICDSGVDGKLLALELVLTQNSNSNLAGMKSASYTDEQNNSFFRCEGVLKRFL